MRVGIGARRGSGDAEQQGCREVYVWAWRVAQVVTNVVQVIKHCVSTCTLIEI